MHLKTSEYRNFGLSLSNDTERMGVERTAFSCSGTSCTPSGTVDISLVMGARALSSSRTHYRVLSHSQESVNGLSAYRMQYVRKTPYDDGGLSVSTTPTAWAYGVWGDQGYALVQVANGNFRAVRKSDKVSLSGTAAAIVPSFRGRNMADSAPGGTGSATWKGPAEAVAIGTFTRHRGTATLTIANLSDPKLSASIRVKDAEIGSDVWNSMDVSGGGFDVGANGTDRLVGAFGTGHGEIWGIFDTSAYIGVFGAKRE
ncbi:MAG: hypothetical protein F4Y03_04950 [Alphaproteobacteria bacterium]|nr:hypothetical protein [Alphaproteobacteria bacterium]